MGILKFMSMEFKLKQLDKRIKNKNSLFIHFIELIGIGKVSNVTNMSNMFNEARTFNQNLSSWCVTNITSKPTNFDRNTYTWSPKSSKLPVWWTCN